MSKQRRFILTASVVGIISVFLPWVVVDAGKEDKYINGFHGYGIIAFIVFVVAAMICFSGDRHKFTGTTIWFIVATGIVALVFIIISLLNNDPSSRLNTKTGFGVWVSLFAAIAVIVSGLFLKGSNTGFKTGLDGFRRSISIPIINAADIKANAGLSKITALEKLTRLRANGDISEEEFNRLKSQLLHIVTGFLLLCSQF
jgi:hypothetical protein